MRAIAPAHAPAVKEEEEKNAPRRRGAARGPLPGVDGAVADAQEVLESPELRGRAGADEVLVGQEQRRDAARRRAAVERAKGLEASPARAKWGDASNLVEVPRGAVPLFAQEVEEASAGRERHWPGSVRLRAPLSGRAPGRCHPGDGRGRARGVWRR